MKRFSKNNCPNTHELTEKNNCVKVCANGKERGSLTKRCKIQCPERTHELTENGNCVKQCVSGKERNKQSKRKRCKQINNTRKRQTPRKHTTPNKRRVQRVTPTPTPMSLSLEEPMHDFSPNAEPSGATSFEKQTENEQLRERIRKRLNKNKPTSASPSSILETLSSADTAEPLKTPVISPEHTPRVRVHTPEASIQQDHPPNKSIKPHQVIRTADLTHRTVPGKKEQQYTALATVMANAKKKTQKVQKVVSHAKPKVVVPTSKYTGPRKGATFIQKKKGH